MRYYCKVQMLTVVFAFSFVCYFTPISAQHSGTIECECLNNQTAPGNGQFLDKVVVKSTSGEIWSVTYVDSLYAMESLPPPADPILISRGTLMTEVTPGNYILEGKRIENTSWYILVSNGKKTLFAYPRHDCKYNIPTIVGDTLICMQSSSLYLLDVPIDLYFDTQWSVTKGGRLIEGSESDSFKIGWENTPGIDTISVSVSVMPSKFGNGTPCFFNIEQEVRIVDEIECLLLPVKLSRFDVKNINGVNRLFWTTSSEVDVDYFRIEKSSDTKHWQEIGNVNASNLLTGKSYSFDDYTIQSSILFYRLKIIDLDGSFEYSDMIYIRTDNVGLEINISPNPSAGIINISNVSGSEIKNLIIINSNNQVVDNIKLQGNQIDISNIPSDIYTLRIETEKGWVNKRIIKI